ncbi:MAG TPA: NADH-quinone oxidoreductase subunit C [Methanocorpusculum sp.]|nr:NADH-quinone oxidoreductase subunit C [Methanocorpusculum sp.]
MDITKISINDVEQTASDMKSQGYRLIVITCTPADEGYEVTYTYDKEFAFKHFRITVNEDDAIPSIGKSYGGAFVFENEIHDLYGFKFEGMTLDYNGTFLRTTVKYPFRKKDKVQEPTVTKVKKESNDHKEGE